MPALRRPSCVLLVLLIALTIPRRAAAAVESIARARELAVSAPKTPVTIHGVVTRYRPGRSLSVQDQGAGIFIYSDQFDLLVPGDIVEATGRASIDESGAPSIADATYRKLGTGPAPDAIEVTAADLDAGRNDSLLVSLEGTVLRLEAGRYEYGLVVSSHDVVFTAWVLRDIAGQAATLEAGTRLRLSGAVSRTPHGAGQTSFELLMRSGADALVLQPPSFWSLRRVTVAAIALSSSSVLLLSYVFLLRRQVQRQTALIAERLRAEADLTAQYQQSQRMEAVGRLAGGIAYDFNNIMTVVLGHSDVLALELADRPDLMESVNELRKASDRASSVTRQLLAFGRRQRLAKTAVDLNDTITSMTAMFGRVLGGDIGVCADVSGAPVIVTIDRAQLEQALLNLAVNARDAMPEGGRLTLSVAREARGAQFVAVLRVADTGSGIPPDAQPHVFDPFFTTKEVGQGSGLGLAMVYGFVKQTGGTIRFDTAPGAGTTFELTFPLAAVPES